MPVIIPPGFAHVAHITTLDTDVEEMVTTYGVGLSDSPNPNELAEDLHTAWGNFIVVPLYGDTYQLTRTEVRIGQDGGEPIQGVHSAIVSGVGTGARLPQNCAVLVQKRSASGGRANRGRMYVPGTLGEASVSDAGAISPSNLTGQQDAFTDLFEALDTGFGSFVTGMVVLHSSALAPTPVTSLIVQALISTQRRRLRP